MTKAKSLLSPLDGAGQTIHLYRAAQRLRADAFAKATFAWIAEQLRADQIMVVTTLRGANWVDAHFHGIADPRALMENHERVKHLDPVSHRMIESPGTVFRHSYDNPDLAGPRFEPFRAHLRRFGGRYVLMVAIPNPADEILTVLMVIRVFGSKRPDFDERDEAFFTAVAPHVAEAFAVNRTTWLGTAAGPAQALPVASIDAEGRFIRTMPAFVRLFWPDELPKTAYLPPAIVKQLEKGKPWPMPDGQHTLHAYREEGGGFLLRIRGTSAADRLSVRERQIAGAFARGASYKAIAKELTLSPATVRNHLQNLYAKLGVTERDQLSALLSQP